MIEHKKIWLGKMLLLLAIILVGGLTASGCIAGLQPVGWSGGLVADGTLFVGSMEGRLVAVDVADGTRQWSEPLTVTSSAGILGCSTASAAVPLYGTPVMAGDLVYLSGYNGKIYAFNATSLQKRWVYPDERTLQSIVSGPVLALDRIYFGCADGKVYALDADTGDKVWESSPAGDKIWSTPVVVDGTVYVTSFDKKLYALDADSGQKRWETVEVGGAIASTPAVYNDTVYFGAFDRYFYAVDTSDGSLKWKSEVEGGKWFWATPVIYEDTIYAPNLDGKVYILAVDTGFELAAAVDLGDPVSSAPVLVAGSIVVASEVGKIYAIEDNRGREITDLETKVTAPLCADDGLVYVHTQEDEALYALDVTTGAELWQISLSSESSE